MRELPTLHTGRLILRPFAAGDAAEVMHLAGDRAIADTTLNIPHPYEAGMAEEWISKHRDAHDREQGLTLAITRRADGLLIGAIGLIGMEKGHQAELGYWVGKPHWNQGYCTEAARAILQHAFSILALLRVHACHLTRNPASGRVLRKTGMTYEGCRRGHIRKWGRLEDLDLYGILAEDWSRAAAGNQSASGADRDAAEISFEPVARADLPALVEWLGSDSWPFHGRSRLDAGQAAATAGTYFAPDVEAFWIVAAGGDRVGIIRLFDLEDYTPLFDLRLRSPFRGRGIGTRAVEWLTRHIFETWPEKGRIEAHTRQDNGAMRRVLRRCGYVKEAHHRAAWPAGLGPRLDSVGYAILRVDWERGGPPTPVAWDDEPATDNLR